MGDTTRVDAGRLWGHLRALCEEIGPRLSGTPADEQSVEYIGGHFRRCGAEVEVQDFPCPGWDHEGTELELLGEGGAEPLPAVAQTFTDGCEVEAELVIASKAHDLEFAFDLEGKVLLLCDELASGLAMNRNLTLLSVEERRPAAVIVASSDEVVSTKLIRDPFLRVPAAAVAKPVGLELRGNAGKRVRLRIRARRYDSAGHNVTGHLPGRGSGRIVVGAHYDTAADTPGAFDDGSGTAVILELCEAFGAAPKREVSIDFIAFGAEEYGRHLRALGSVEYVRRHPAETKETQAVVQVDGVGCARAQMKVHVMGWPAQEKEAVLRVVGRFPRYGFDEEEVTGSDHVPFRLNGVPAVVFMSEYRSIAIHTAEDTVDLLSSDELASTAEVVAAVVRHLACVD